MRIAQAETAIVNYHSRVKNDSERQKLVVLNHSKSCGEPMSIGEVAHDLGWQKSTVSRCMNEMLSEFKPRVVAYPKRKDRISGVMIRPVGIPPVGQQELFQ